MPWEIVTQMIVVKEKVLTIIVFSSVMWVSHSRAPPGVAARLIADRENVILEFLGLKVGP
jgi:hypothetical protein